MGVTIGQQSEQDESVSKPSASRYDGVTNE